jgi:ribosome biogenesis ATPase
MPDARLCHHVNAALESLQASQSSLNVDTVLEALKRAHPEHNRKKQLFLRKAVEEIRSAWMDARSSAGGPMPSSSTESAPLDASGGASSPASGPASASLNDALYQVRPAAQAQPQAQQPPRVPKRKRDAEREASAGAPPASLTPVWELPAYANRAERFSDVGGLAPLLRVLRDVIEYPLACPGVYAHLGVDPPRGVLLAGAPGCGKSLLAHALAGELQARGVYVRSVSGPELVGGLSGESEARLRAVFEDVVTHAPAHGGALLFIDELDVIAPRRDSTQRGMELRMVSQLMTCIDGLALGRTGGAPVMLLAASNKPESIDPGLRRTGRFDRELTLPIPDEGAREAILRVLCARVNLCGAAGGGGGASFDWRAIARATPGYVGADLAALIKEAAAVAIARVLGVVAHGTSTSASSCAGADSASSQQQPPPFDAPSAESLTGLQIIMADFLAATSRVQPSALREGFATVPNVSWEDVGALAGVRDELGMAILQPLRRPAAFAALGLSVPAGVLLFGPPGCGKTLLAKAIAAESAANFISVKGPELLDKYVGESERAVRALFQRARASSPCIVFFDELDALAPRRGGGGDGGSSSSSSSSSVTERVVNQLLTEMDGLETRRDVFVIAATNRPDMIDPAMLRPGRLDKLLYVPLPDAKDRAAILKTQARKMPLGGDVDFAALAAHPKAARFSGADLAALVREGAVSVLKRYFEEQGVGVGGAAAPGGLPDTPPPPCMRDFLSAFDKVQASVSREDELLYESLRAKLRS